MGEKSGVSQSELAATLERLAAVEDTIVQTPKATLRPALSESEAKGRDRLGALAKGMSPIGSGLDLEAVLGEGGMGIVHLATQRSLGRKVAVKTFRPGPREESETLRLLREAWVTGSLEHPNVVPVHDLGFDENGAPMIVLKRIEGVAWSELVADPERVARQFGVEDSLEFNLGILLQVCNALTLAHSRGIIHRDVKPENVMVGQFGEVYLVDWGLALSLRPDATGRLPVVSDLLDPAGTPAYMAPEMLRGETALLSQRTDVYLLGGVLFEILTGKAPHAGSSLRQILASILESSVELPESAPSELAAICKRALSPEPSDRHGTVDELRTALTAFQRHRSSLAIADEATQRLAELRRLLAAVPAAEQRTRVYNLFGATRFGFQQALRSWPGNDAALAGLHTAIEAMVDFELDHGFPEQAAAILGELEAPPPELAARVEAERNRRTQERERIERLGREFDPSVGGGTRAVVGAAIGLLFTVTPLGGLFFETAGGPQSSAPAIWRAAGLLLASLLVALLGRKALAKTAVNRRVALAMVLGFSAQIILEIGGSVLGIKPATTIVLHLFNWFVVLSMVAIAVDRRVAPAAVGYLACFLFLCHAPQYRWYVMSAANFGVALTAFIAWRKPAPG